MIVFIIFIYPLTNDIEHIGNIALNAFLEVSVQESRSFFGVCLLITCKI